MPHEQEPHSRLPLLLVLLTGAMALVLAAVEVESLSPVLGNISMLLASPGPGRGGEAGQHPQPIGPDPSRRLRTGSSE